MEDWLGETFTHFSIDRQFPSAATYEKLDVKEFVDMLVKSHVECVWEYTKCHWGYSYYDTKIGWKHPNLKGDFFGEFLDLAHGRGLKVFAYYSLLFDNMAALHNPDWCMRHVDGSVIRYELRRAGEDIDRWYMLCTNSAYYQYVLDQLDEIGRNYRADGLFIDIPTSPNGQLCYCRHCKEAYSAEYGADLPSIPKWDEEWKKQVEWRMNVSERFWQEIRSTIHSHLPDIPVASNYFPLFGRPWSYGRGTFSLEDFVLGEDGGSKSGQASTASTFIRGLGSKHHMTSVAVDVFNPVSDHLLDLEVSTILAHRGLVMLFTLGGYVDGSLDKEYFDRMERAYRNVGAKKEYVKGATPIKYAAVVHSDATRIYYGRDDAQSKYGSSLTGAIQFLIDQHLPCEVLPDWSLNLENLRQFGLVILPNIACISREGIENLQCYVREGGSIIATYETSLYDEKGNFLGDFQLKDAYGLRYFEHCTTYARNYFQSFLNVEDESLAANLPKTLYGIPGSFLKVVPTSGKNVCNIVLPAVSDSAESFFSWTAAPGSRTNYPAVNVNDFGKGKVIYAAPPLFKLFHEGVPPQWDLPAFKDSMDWIRDLMGLVVEKYASPPPIRVKAPYSVHSTFFKQPDENRLVIHLINRTSLQEVVPVRDLEISISKDFVRPKSVSSVWPEKKSLLVQKQGETLKINIPEVRVHEIVVLDL